MLLPSRPPDADPVARGPESRRARPPRPLVATLPFLAHVGMTAWLFWPALTGAGVFYFRDITAYYFPEYTFVARALAQGVWPLWNPAADAGGPYLMGYPINLLLVALAGPRGALALAPAVHVLLAACGATVLGFRLGWGAWGAWAAGAAYALTGSFLSQAFFPNFYAAAWAPWIFAILLRHDRWPPALFLGTLAVAGALQVSTFGGEVVLQTALLAVVLAPRAFVGRSALRVLGAGALAAAMVLPVALGTWAIVEGTRRGQGFQHEMAFGYSATTLVLLESVLPRFFGELHTFSDVGFWGQPFFRAGYPYVPSLYVGTAVLLLASLAGRSRLWLVAALGLLMSLGDHGPLEPVLVPLLTVFRAPVKFFFLTAAALAFLAGQGTDRVASGRLRPRAWVVLPGLLLTGVGLVLALDPAAGLRILGRATDALNDPRAQFVVRTIWPWEFLRTGLVCLAAGLALVASRRLAPLAAVLAAVELLAVNARLNPTADPDFYALRPAMRQVVDEASAEGLARWFSYGVLSSPGLLWNPAVALRNSDVALYAATRQSLVPITHELDDLEGAFDLDHMGWAPAGSTLTVQERTPARHREIHARLRLANVRWVLSFHDLPADLVTLRRQVQLREIHQPQRWYEVNDPLPRAFWVGEAEVLSDPEIRRRRLEDPAFDARRAVVLEVPAPVPASAPGTAAAPPAVAYERLDPHTVRLRATTPPGYLVVLDGHHRHWRVEGAEGPSSPLRANGRYWALPTAGGDRTITLRYAPPWRTPALALSALAGLGALVLAVVPLTARRHEA